MNENNKINLGEVTKEEYNFLMSVLNTLANNPSETFTVDNEKERSFIKAIRETVKNSNTERV